MEGENDNAALTVECYSCHTYAEEPRAFTWQGRRYEVTEIKQRWREPQGPVFRLRTADGQRWQLAYDQTQDSWSLQVLV